MRTKTDEAVSLRGFYLRLLSRWYLVPLAALAGAILGALLYYCVHVLWGPGREYAGGARLYLEFSADAAGNARDYYNAWTWKELITGDDILGPAMELLVARGAAPAEERTNQALPYDRTTVKKEDDELVLVPGPVAPGATITRAEVLSSVTVRLPSDLRVMMLTVTHRDAARANLILDAMTDSLTAYGESNYNFREIRILEKTPALLLVTTDRTGRAMLLGAGLALCLAVFGLSLFYAADDALYDPEMCGRRYGRPVLGLLPAGEDPASEKETTLALRFEEELRTACGKLLAGAVKAEAGWEEAEGAPFRIAVIAAPEDGERVCAALKERLGAGFLGGRCTFLPISEHTDPESGRGTYDAAVVGVPYGRRNSAYVDHVLSVLEVRGIPLAGLVLYDADLRYLRRLYGL